MVLFFAFSLAGSFQLARAAAPGSGTVTPAGPTVTYGGGPFSQTNQTGTAGPPTEPTCVNPLLPCDDFSLTVTIPPSDTNTYFVNVVITFETSADFDLYILDSSGNTLNESVTGDMPEAVRVHAQTGTHVYTVRVTPYSVATGAGGDTYAANVTLSQLVAPPDPPVLPTVAGVPRFKTTRRPKVSATARASPRSVRTGPRTR